MSTNTSSDSEQLLQENFAQLKKAFLHAGLPPSSVAALPRNSIFLEKYSRNSCAYSLDPYSRVLHLPKDFFTKCSGGSTLPVLFFKLFAYQFPHLMMENFTFLGVYQGSTSALSSIEQKEEFVEKLSQDFLLWLRSSDQQCIKPWTYRQFDRIFEARASSCDKPYYLPIVKGVRTEFQLIEPSSIQRIDYVIAGKGGGPESMWGHSMFRIVLCDSDQSKGKCALSNGNHLMLQFGGLVNENTMNYVAGITGGYQSEFNILPFDSHIKKYTYIENRSVHDYPLRFSKQQIEEFMLLIRQIVLSPQPNYSFFLKNCATQSLLLTSILLKRNIFLYRLTTPDALLSYFQKQGWAQDSASAKEVLGKYRDELEKTFQSNFYQPTYFSSFQERLDRLGFQDFEEDHQKRMQQQEKGMDQLMNIYKTQWSALTLEQKNSVVGKARNAAVIESEYLTRFKIQYFEERQKFFEKKKRDLTQFFMDEYIQTKKKLIQLNESSQQSSEEFIRQRDLLLKAYDEKTMNLENSLNEEFNKAKPDLLKLEAELRDLNDRLNRFAFLLASKIQ